MKTPRQIYPSEHDEQCSVIQWRDAVVFREPLLRLLIANPNGGYRPIKTALTMKKEGQKKGVSDLQLPVPSGQFIGLWIELKKHGNTYPTPEQREWLMDMNQMGHLAVWCRGAADTIWVLEQYLQRYNGWLPQNERHKKPQTRF